jgi:molybdenum cofactor synthesis domain-containing protein
MRVAIVTISDSISAGDGSDTSGAAVRSWCSDRGDDVVSHDVIGDETSIIAPLLASLCDSGTVDLVVTTGGTGLSRRDVTPEATRAVIERDAPGIAEFIRASSFDRVPRAALSRGIAGTRGSTLIVNLPGSTQGVQDGLTTILPIIDHAIGVLSGAVTRHDNAAPAKVST